jgi:hypothetical protein
MSFLYLYLFVSFYVFLWFCIFFFILSNLPLETLETLESFSESKLEN